ncbi:MAG: methyltransferase domain-containing protein [Sphingomonas sp.]
MAPTDIFDRALRRQRRDRAAPGYQQADFLRRFMLDELCARLAAVKRTFTDALDLGCFDAALVIPAKRLVRCDAGLAFATAAQGVQADEDRLPFADASFDLIVCAGILDQVNDVPGALSLIRRVLRPDGLFLGAFAGAGSLATLREAMRFAEDKRPVARLHPQIDVRAAGDLLQRTGFALPVADTQRLTVRYGSLFGLTNDLRQMAAGNIAPKRHPLRRDSLARASDRFAALADPDGRTAESFDMIFLTGWSPGPDQPRPARRGSATTSLADALKSSGKTDL